MKKRLVLCAALCGLVCLVARADDSADPSWLGVAPLPPGASAIPTQTAQVHCTLFDTNGDMVGAFMTREDCAAWAKKSNEMQAKSREHFDAENTRITLCARDLASRAVQQYSGQFLEICRRLADH